MKKLLFIILIIIGGICIVSYNYYAEPSQRPPYKFHHFISSDTLNIAFIGDSWALLHRNHSCLIDKILEDSLNQTVKIYSYGLSGMTSKMIYENMFNNEDFKHFLQKRNYKYCYISAGINDTYKKMSKDYYAKSMEALLRFFIYNNVTPILIDIPDYNIEKCYQRQTVTRKALRQLSMFVNNTPIDCKHLFRKTLDSILTDYKGKVILLHYKEWNSHYAKDLQLFYQEDGLHLNSAGYSALDRQIGLCLLKQANYSFKKKTELRNYQVKIP